MTRTILVGAVAYYPRVVPILEGMRDYFREAGPAIDYVLYSNYDRQVQALLDRQIDLAWNTNLAWAKVCHHTSGACRALAMRDVDAEFFTFFVARADSGIRTLADLKGKRVALGSADSVQAAILPVHFLRQAGLDPERDCRLLRFDRDVGKHGDTGTSELDVLAALRAGQADAGALGSSTWTNVVGKDRALSQQFLPFWTSPAYCHCNFTALADFPADLGRRWTDSLVAMSHDEPRWQPLMDLEGLKRWLVAEPSILKGYDLVLEAAQAQRLWNSTL
jgi:phosphonate transport system substrate-binding protein